MRVHQIVQCIPSKQRWAPARGRADSQPRVAKTGNCAPAAMSTGGGCELDGDAQLLLSLWQQAPSKVVRTGVPPARCPRRFRRGDPPPAPPRMRLSGGAPSASPTPASAPSAFSPLPDLRLLNRSLTTCAHSTAARSAAPRSARSRALSAARRCCACCGRGRATWGGCSRAWWRRRKPRGRGRSWTIWRSCTPSCCSRRR